MYRIVKILAALCAALLLAVPVLAVEVDDIYCFSSTDFSEAEDLTGICVTEVPAEGAVRLGSRIIRAGDILTVEQLSRLTYEIVGAEDEQTQSLSYLPVFADEVAQCATMAISVRGKRDQAPVAEDSAMETYKNLPGEAMLKVKDPEGQPMTYTVTRQPKRGDVVIREDGSVIYTPRKNKVGVDSFTYTATDPAGNVSREATVTVTIMKPTDAQQYADTAGDSCRFAAEWMKNTGIFVAERVGGNSCFQPGKEVSRGEFLTMLVGALDLNVEEAEYTGFADEAPQWLKPYLAAAMRSGLTAGWPEADTFAPEQTITGAEAAVMLQNALKLDQSEAQETVAVEETAPDWAVSALTALQSNGISLNAGENLTRGEAAQILYQACKLAQSAPGTRVKNVVQ